MGSVTEFSFVLANLFRKKIRTTLMIVSVFIAFTIFGVMVSFQQAFDRPSDLAADNRLITANKISFTQPMPAAYAARIARLDGVVHVSGSNWLGGYFQEPRNTLVALAVDPNDYLDVYASDIVVAPEDRQRFATDRGSMLVGQTLAMANGWKVGDRIPIGSDLYLNRVSGTPSWNLVVAGVLRPRTRYTDTNYLIFHDRMFNETRSSFPDTLTWITVLTSDVAHNDAVAAAIDGAFANSAAETHTDTEKAFNRAFAAQFGDIALIVRLVVGAAMITILMIVGNTLFGAIRERAREIAVLKTLGFNASRITRIVLAEALLIITLGGLAGLALAAFLLTGLVDSLAAITPDLAMTGNVVLLGLALMLLLGLVSGIVPAWNAIRLNAASAFRRD